MLRGGQRLARAKINLFLHVGPVAADGYHPLCSLVSFADVGDVVTLETAAGFGFEADGPFAAELGDAESNLIIQARDLMVAAFQPSWTPFRLTLQKNLPIASGVGGGSADAAAAMELMAERAGLNPDSADQRRLYEVAARLGSDVPMCLNGEPRIASGRGDVLSRPPAFPNLRALLVNPLRPSPTGAVYRAYDAAGAPGRADTPAMPEVLDPVEAVAAFLAGCRNDLEAPAISLQPAIGEVLAALRGKPQTLFARMSGSGATCFALCVNDRDHKELARAIATQHPDWWVQRCWIAGRHP